MIRVQTPGKDQHPLHAAVPIQKHERAARESIHHMIEFNSTVEKEILNIKEAERHGHPADAEMMQKLLAVKEGFANAMDGMRRLDATGARHKLIAYSDALRDLMAYYHHGKH